MSRADERSTVQSMVPIVKSRDATSESLLARLSANVGILIFAAIIPALVLTVFFSLKTGEILRNDRERELTEMMRALSVAVDSELLQVTRFISAIATSEAIRRGDFAQFDAGMRRMIAATPSITVIHILDLDAQQYVVHSDFPVGTKVEAGPNAVSQAQAAVESGKATIFGIRETGPNVERPFIPVRAPISHDGKATHVISAGISPDYLSKVFEKINFDERYTAAVIDADFRIAARSRAIEKFAGRRVNAPLANALTENKSGFFESINQEGDRLYSVFARSSETGWSVVAGIPTDVIDAPIQRMIVIIFSIAAAAVGIGVALASFIAVKINAVRARERSLNLELEQMVEDRSSELRASEERYRAIVEDQTEMIIRIERTGRLTFANREFRTFFGLSDSDDLGGDFYQLVCDEDQLPLIEAADDLFEYPHSIEFLECKMKAPGGKAYWQTWVFRSILDGVSRRIVEVQGVGRDITDLKSTQDQLRHAQKMEALGQMTGGLAHDFNNILAIVRGNAELLKDEFGPSPMLGAIERAAFRGAELTNRLLSFSRRQDLRPKSIDPHDFLDKLVALLRRTLGVEIEIVHVSSKDTWRIFADEGQLENALVNLAVNARDAMPAGGLLEFRCNNVPRSEASSWFPEGKKIVHDFVEISVRDSGIGIAPETLDHVLDPFFTTKDVGKGSGLGLAMVDGFIQLSGGAIRIESELKSGTCVGLLLPRTQAEVEEDVPQHSLLPRASGETILVVEDDRDVRDFVKLALENLDYGIIEGADSAEALEVLKSEQKVDLLLSDIRLPNGANGIELAKQFRLHRPNGKILLMSGYVDESMDNDPSFAGGFRVLKKPFRREDLAWSVKQALEQPALTLA